jgi:hypothetical protein
MNYKKFNITVFSHWEVKKMENKIYENFHFLLFVFNFSFFFFYFLSQLSPTYRYKRILHKIKKKKVNKDKGSSEDRIR